MEEALDPMSKDWLDGFHDSELGKECARPKNKNYLDGWLTSEGEKSSGYTEPNTKQEGEE